MDYASPIIPESEHDVQSNSGSSSLSPSNKVPCFLSTPELRNRREAVKGFPEVPAGRQPSDEEECRVEQLVHRITTEKRRRKGRCELPRPLFCTRFTGPLPRPYLDPSYVPEPHNPDIPLELANNDEEWEAQQTFRDKKRAEKKQLREKVIGWQASIGDLVISQGISTQSVEQALLDTGPGTPVISTVDVENVTAPEAKAHPPSGIYTKTISTVDQDHRNQVSIQFEFSRVRLTRVKTLPITPDSVLEPPRHSTPRPSQAPPPCVAEDIDDISLLFEQSPQVITPVRQLTSPPDSRTDPPMEIGRPETPTGTQGQRNSSQRSLKRPRSSSPLSHHDTSQRSRLSKYNPAGVSTPLKLVPSGPSILPVTPNSESFSFKRVHSWNQSQIPSTPASAREALQKLPTMQQLVRESAKKKRAGLSQSVSVQVVTPSKSHPHSESQSQSQTQILTGRSRSTTDYLYTSQPRSARTAGLNSQDTDASYRKELDRAASNVAPVAKPAKDPVRRTGVWGVRPPSPYGENGSPTNRNPFLNEIGYNSQFSFTQDIASVSKILQDDVGDVYG